MNHAEQKYFGINYFHNLDGQAGLATVPNNFVDLVLTDPPYNASNSNIEFKEKGYNTINQAWDKGFLTAPIIKEIQRIGKQRMIFCSYHLLADWINGGGTPRQIIHWIKTNPFPAIAKVYTPNIEYVLWWADSPYFFNKKLAGQNIIISNICSGLEREEHPSQKPLEVIFKLLNVHSDDGAIVFDPFMGSGTTAVACERLGRKWFGCELEPKYVAIANKRIEAERAQLKLF